MTDILQKILATKAEEVAAAKPNKPTRRAALSPPSASNTPQGCPP